jgi:3-hydroxyisobutyrate dehydrogenase
MPTSAEVAAVVERMGPLRQKPLLVDCTSGDFQRTRDLAARLRARGGRGVVDAPVSGGPAGAAAGKLSVIVGGSAEHVQEVGPLLQSFAKAITHVGVLGAAHAVKCVNNALNVTHLLAASEGVVALAKIGVDPAVALQAISQSSGRSLMSEVRLPKEVLSGKFDYGFKLGLMAKDVRLCGALLDQEYGEARLLRETSARVHEAVRRYGPDVDYTFVSKLVEAEADHELVKGPARARL